MTHRKGDESELHTPAGGSHDATLPRRPVRPPRPPLLPAELEARGEAFVLPDFPIVPEAEGEIPELPFEAGTTHVDDRAAFEALSRRDNVPGAMGIRELKLLVTGVDSDSPTLYFINTQTFSFHYDFATRGLGLRLSLRTFNSQTYFTDNRRFLAGSLLAHDSFVGEDGVHGLYTLEFWPTDPVGVQHVALAYDLVRAGMPFAASQVAYHAAGETQRALFAAQQEAFEEAAVRTITTEALFAQVRYSPLNLGEGYGLLRLIDGADPRPPSVRDVVIFRAIPNDLSHVAGVLTEEPQTPLSHINLKAKQNNTPNAYLEEAAADPRVAPLLGKLIRLEVAADDLAIREATQEEVDTFLEAVRPSEPQIPVRDLSRDTIASLDDLGHGDLSAYGAKAANVAELLALLPAGMVPRGHAVPFAFYHRFMEENGFYEEVVAMMEEEGFHADPAVREDALAKLRKRIRKKGTIAVEHLDALQAMFEAFPPGTTPRCRSSTNNEDLEGFNGAGLYDSYTHRLDEGHIEKSIRQVWASLWNYRAFEERAFYRIDHLATAMAVLVHPNFDDEKANGVAVTKNIYDPSWEGYYVNVQVGEALVTNPDPGATPDELLVSAIGPNNELETQYIRHSSLVAAGETVLSVAQIDQLVVEMRRIQAHFRRVYERQNDPAFAMDIEFKIDVDDQLVIKQARPWVD